GRASDGGAASGGWRSVALATNGDGQLDAADPSPLVPAPADAVGVLGPARRRQAIHLDVTTAFAGGPGVYTLAIGGATGAAYASREHRIAARRPVLEGAGAPTAMSEPGRAAVFRIANSSFQHFTDRPRPETH